MDKVTWLGVQELSEYLGIARHTIYQLTYGRRIPFYKKTGKIFFRLDEIDAWIMDGRISCRKSVLNDE